jgi:uncharacterized protein YecT (DUF1311 family)
MRIVWTAIALIATISSSACHAREAAPYPTQDCNKANTQLDLNQCAQANFESADRKLNEVYRAAMDASGDEASRTQLRDSERTWIQSRDQECARQVGPREGGGSIWPMNMASCLEEKTAQRIRELRRD